MSNNKFVIILNRIADKCESEHDMSRAIAFRKAADTLNKPETPVITSGNQARMFHGIGLSTAKIIDEVIATGTSNRLR